MIKITIKWNYNEKAYSSLEEAFAILSQKFEVSLSSYDKVITSELLLDVDSTLEEALSFCEIMQESSHDIVATNILSIEINSNAEGL